MAIKSKVEQNVIDQYVAEEANNLKRLNEEIYKLVKDYARHNQMKNNHDKILHFMKKHMTHNMPNFHEWKRKIEDDSGMMNGVEEVAIDDITKVIMEGGLNNVK